MRRLRFCSVVIVAMGLALMAPAAVASSDGAPTVRVAKLKADIDPVTADWIIGELHSAESDHDAAFVLELDTPGGLETSMRDIYQHFLAARIPVIVYVGPAGARAASAGFVILQSADVAAMNPISNAGSATPISEGPGGASNVPSDLRRKIIADAAAQIESLARQHGRNVLAARRAVNPYRTANGSLSLANYTAPRALALHVVDDVAPDLPTLLRQIDGRTTTYKHLRLHVAGAHLDTHGLPVTLRVLDILIDPNLIFLLFLGGIAGIVFEVLHPGIVLPGLIGGVSLILSLLGLSVVPFSWAGVALMVVGLVLLGLEAHVAAHGAFAAVGAAALALGGIILFRVPDSAGTVSVWLAILFPLILAAFALFVVTKTLAARRAPVTTGISEMIGARAIVRRPLTPDGQVFVHGERWRAIIDAGGAVASAVGDEVIVTGIEGLVLHVVPANAVASAPDPAAPPLPQGA